MIRSEVTTAAVGIVVQPTQLGVQQVATRPQTRMHMGQDPDDFDALDLEEY